MQIGGDKVLQIIGQQQVDIIVLREALAAEAAESARLRGELERLGASTKAGGDGGGGVCTGS